MEWAGWTGAALRVAVLAAFALVLLVVTVASARRPSTPISSLAEYLSGWSVTHGGYDVGSGSVWVRGWLSSVYRVARPLARVGVQPDVLTAWTVWLSLAVLTAAAGGGRWLMVAGWLAVLSGMGDSLDGAVAVLTSRTSRWGYVLDSVVDRINDVVYVIAVVAAGAPPALGGACALSFFLLEYLRARAGNAGSGEIAKVTVGERPNRVALCAAGLYLSGVFLGRAPEIATTTLAALTGLTVIGLVQLGVAVRRQLTG